MAAERSGAIHSMTGYGRAAVRRASANVTVELRSTNHRYLEIEPRLPNGLTAFHARLAELIRSRIRRGRVEVAVSLQLHDGHARRVVFDERLLRGYYEALASLRRRFRLEGPVTLDHLLALPHAVAITEERVPAERLWSCARLAVQQALRELVRSRQREGAKLTADLKKQLAAIERHLRAIEQRLPKALEEQRRLVRERVQGVVGAEGVIPAASLEQAISLLRETDVHEELVRLKSHLSHIRETLAGRQLVGKRLDFIAQELMREVNTMGAKVGDAAAAPHVVEIKGCIEKIREQVQNLE